MAALTGTPRFAVIDLETTGLFPERHRIVEIAIVRLAADLAVIDEWTTLVNPQRDIGPTSLHGISAAEVAGAPTFAEIVGDLRELVAGTELVAHNARFDVGFLMSELERAGVQFDEPEPLCTLQLAGGGRLGVLCEEHGIELVDAHTALGDARATAELFVRLLAAEDVERLAAAEPAEWLWADVEASGRVHQRGTGVAVEGAGRLAAIADRLEPVTPVGADAAAVWQYADLLGLALEDRAVTEDEATTLMDTSIEWGLSRSDVLDVHYHYLNALVRAAWADGVITPAERRDLHRVGLLLGADLDALDEWIDSGEVDDAVDPVTQPGLAGLMVCFTGAGDLDRAELEELALGAGMTIWPRVTKKVDILVVADPASGSSKVQMARKYGLRIMTIEQFLVEAGD